jgi:hypothetical protein
MEKIEYSDYSIFEEKNVNLFDENMAKNTRLAAKTSSIAGATEASTRELTFTLTHGSSVCLIGGIPSAVS